MTETDTRRSVLTLDDIGWANSRIDELEAGRDALQAKLDRAEEAFHRQADNMAFVLNHMDVKNWYEKFTDELAQDRTTLVELKGTNHDT